jgi:NADPH:quinone reductase-like Zn-dependent oxidoreductase
MEQLDPCRVAGLVRALIYAPDQPSRLQLADVDEPVAGPSEAVVDVRAFALNFGELHWIDRMRKPGDVPGWDAAGVVAQAAADGSGLRPAVGW